MKTFHIHIKGCVQGVGFRPFVYRLAADHQLTGWVNNATDGLHVEINAEERDARAFYRACITGCPPQAIVNAHSMREVPHRACAAFEIVSSEADTVLDLALTPDFGLCPNCREELGNPDNRRFGYAFITCTHCGPRYSILTGLPYDRPYTSMQDFAMCVPCQEEYRDPLDRRYYSQTNSCPDCGVQMSLCHATGETWRGAPDLLLKRAIHALKQGQTLAVKGIGGYLLMGDATQDAAIARLRARKQRPDKPFAVLYPNAHLLAGDVVLSAEALEALQGAVAPIVLLPMKPVLASGLCRAQVAPGLSQLGVMLPYAPLLQLIADAFARPLVATSANLSGSPIVYEDAEAHARLFAFADYVLSHNRAIACPQDDSVLKLTPGGQQSIWLRRSRGLAPNVPAPVQRVPHLLAMGAHMKGSIAISTARNLFVSQYLGRLDSYEAEQHYRQTLAHLMGLLKATPRTVQVDLHPDYLSTRLGQELAAKHKLKLECVQHHEAHFAAILGEHQLAHASHEVLGVIWDGTGHGHDGQVWGGEFLRYAAGTFDRVGQLAYVPQLAGDNMAREPRLAALAFLRGNAALRPSFSAMEWKVYQQLLKRPRGLTSSMGRLFDAVAHVLGLLDKQTYEGQAGLLLEQLGQRYLDTHPGECLPPLPMAWTPEGAFDATRLLEAILNAKQSGASVGYLALGFHATLVDMVEAMAQRVRIHHLAFSGGVFQNGLLVDLLIRQLSPSYTLYFHKQLPPNDENIAFGQVVHHGIRHPREVAAIIEPSNLKQICV